MELLARVEALKFIIENGTHFSQQQIDRAKQLLLLIGGMR